MSRQPALRYASAAFGAAGGRLQKPLRGAVADGAGAGAEAGFDGGFLLP